MDDDFRQAKNYWDSFNSVYSRRNTINNNNTFITNRTHDNYQLLESKSVVQRNAQAQPAASPTTHTLRRGRSSWVTLKLLLNTIVLHMSTGRTQTRLWMYVVHYLRNNDSDITILRDNKQPVYIFDNLIMYFCEN